MSKVLGSLRRGVINAINQISSQKDEAGSPSLRPEPAAEPSFDSMRTAQSAIDTAAKKKVISKQAAARRIKHIARTAKEAGVKIPSKKK